MYYKFSKISIIIHVVVSSCWDLSVVSVFSASHGQVSTDQAECSSDGHWEEFDSGPSSCGYGGGRSLFNSHQCWICIVSSKSEPILMRARLQQSRFCGLRVGSGVCSFSDDVALLASSGINLHLSVEWFATHPP